MDDLTHDIYRFKVYKITFTTMGLEKQGSEVLQNALLQKEGPHRKRKVGRCIGNLYCTFDECPFKLSAEGKQSTTNFQNVDGHKVCFSCGNVASRQRCSTYKMTEYCRESESLTVYCIGAHKCPLKPDTIKYRKQVRDAVFRKSGLGA